MQCLYDVHARIRVLLDAVQLNSHKKLSKSLNIFKCVTAALSSGQDLRIYCCRTHHSSFNTHNIQRKNVFFIYFFIKFKYRHAAHKAALLLKELSLWLAAVLLLYLEKGTTIPPCSHRPTLCQGSLSNFSPHRTNNNLCVFMLRPRSDVACSQ